MLEKIINSKTRLAILSFLFQNVAGKYYSREIANRLNLDEANVYKELANLEAGGFIASEMLDNRKYFFVNEKNTFFVGLQEILKHYGNKDEFIIIEEIPDYYPMMVALPWNTYYTNRFLDQIGLQQKFSHLLSTYKNNICQILVPKGEFEKIGLEMLEKVQNDESWGEQIIADLGKREQDLYNASNNLKKKNLKALSNRELFNIYDAYYQTYSSLHIFHWIHTASDLGDNVFSKYLMQYLKKKIENTPHTLGDVFSILTTPTKEAKPTEEYRNLLNILKHIIVDKEISEYFSNTDTRMVVKNLYEKDPRIDDMLDEHVENFGWLGYGVVGPSWSKEYFIDILGSLIRQKSDPEKLLKAMDDNRENVMSRQQHFIEELSIDTVHQRVFKFARDLVFTKGTRKDSMFHSYSVIENLFREIGRRNYLSLRQVRYMYPHEFKKLLIDEDFQTSVLNDRFQTSIYYSSGKYEDDLILTGQESEDFLSKVNIIKENIDNVKILYGDCASPGKVRGEVRVVNVVKDISKMNQGDVLVSISTNPDLVPAIKKASAIITDVGGITCHAAIISRELGIPCVVGTKIATKVLTDTDIVDVNATHGKIDIISK